MSKRQIMIDQINGIIACLPGSEKNKLPKSLISYFKDSAKVLPEEAIDPMKDLKEQDISDETLIMLVYINKILKGKKVFE